MKDVAIDLSFWDYLQPKKYSIDFSKLVVYWV